MLIRNSLNLLKSWIKVFFIHCSIAVFFSFFFNYKHLIETLNHYWDKIQTLIITLRRLKKKNSQFFLAIKKKKIRKFKWGTETSQNSQSSLCFYEGKKSFINYPKTFNNQKKTSKKPVYFHFRREKKKKKLQFSSCDCRFF